MSTVSRNNIYKGTQPTGIKEIVYPTNNASFPINQGDMVWLDTSVHYIKSLDSDAHATSLVGVAGQPSAVNSNLDNGTIPAPLGITVLDAAIFSMFTTPSESYSTGTVVYYGVNAQTITNASGSNKVGTIILPPSLGVGPLTGATGVQVPVYIKSILV